MTEFRGGVRINASIDDVWDLITRVDDYAGKRHGIDLSRKPDNDRLEPGMELTLNLGLAALRGHVRVQVDDVDETKHIFRVSVRETRITQPARVRGVRGGAIIGLIDRSKTPDNPVTELGYVARITLTKLEELLALPLQKFILDREILPSVGERIAIAAQKRHE